MAPRLKRAKRSSSSSTAQPCSQGGKIRKTLLLHDEENPHNIVFQNDEHKSRYDRVVKNGIEATKYMDDDCLRTLGLIDDVHALLDHIGCLKFLELKLPMYERITLEFLSSLQIAFCKNEGSRDGKIKFRLFDTTQEMSLAQFNQVLSLPVGGNRVPPMTFNYNDFWHLVTHGAADYNPSRSKASFVCNPCFRYILRLLSHTIVGRANSDGVVTKKELYLLACMLDRTEEEDFKVDVGAMMLLRMNTKGSSQSGRIVVGGLLTAIAMKLGFESKLRGLPSSPGGSRLGIETCLNMQLVKRVGDHYYLHFKGRILFCLPHRDRTDPNIEENWKYEDDHLVGDDDQAERRGEQAENEECEEAGEDVICAVPLVIGGYATPKRHAVADDIENSSTLVVKATYKEDTTRFEISCACGVSELKEAVGKKLNLDLSKFKMKFKDEEGELILMMDDSDLEHCLRLVRSDGSNIVRLLILDL